MKTTTFDAGNQGFKRLDVGPISFWYSWHPFNSFYAYSSCKGAMGFGIGPVSFDLTLLGLAPFGFPKGNI